MFSKHLRNKERSHRVALTKGEILHAVTFRTLLSSRGVLQSPLPFVLTLLYGVYTLLISQEIHRSALWAVFTLPSPLYQHTSACIRLPEEVKSLRREKRGRRGPERRLQVLNPGLKSGQESTPSPERHYQDSLRLLRN